MTKSEVVSQEGANELGRIVGDRYVLQRLLGAGAMGSVYEAEPTGGGAPVAVKLLHKHLLAHPQALKRFRREGRTTAGLVHPNCVVVLDADTDGASGDPYLVMELLRGSTLSDELRSNFPVPLARVRSIVLQILAAIHAAHRQGVIHRDLKPANVMLVSDGAGGELVKVCDFGIAKIVDAADSARPLEEGTSATAQFFVGTPEYMSPEQARGDLLDGRSDVYATGVILYQMLTGEVPFRAASPVGTLARKLAEAPPRPSVKFPHLRLPTGLESLVARALRRNPDERLPSAEAFARELSAIVISDDDARAFADSLRDMSRRNAQAATIVGEVARTRGGRGVRLIVSALLVAGIAGSWLARTRDASPVLAARPTNAAAGAPEAPEAAAAASLAAPALASARADPGPAAGEHASSVRRPRELAPKHVGRAVAPARRAEATVTAPARPSADAPSSGTSLATADALIVEGHVGEACASAERAKRNAPRAAAIYKFLGQCYMRVGRTIEAKANYSVYLRLRPDAPDAGFIRGILK